ncbi:hypothetical protein J7L70_03115 [Candidatus Bathyarchaeota archaeon]|nr:hypothetical protein [Candidatus Bathyarchaeota archaeon]
MSDIDLVVRNIEHLTVSLSKLSKLNERLKALDRLQTRLIGLETVFSKYPELNIDEVKDALVKVLENPRLTNAQRVAVLAKNIETFRRKGFLKTRRDRDLVKLGLMILMLPEPTPVTALIGLSLVAAGMMHKNMRK